jgi:hypothetical protein
VVIRESQDAADVTAQLAEALAAPPEPISQEELAQIHAKFSWASIVPAFYQHVARELQCRRCTPLLLEQSVMDVQRDCMQAKDFEVMMERRRRLEEEEGERRREREQQQLRAGGGSADDEGNGRRALLQK